MPRISEKAELERRAKLIEVAQKEFLTKGFEKTTIKDMTDKLNLATGTFYYHFKSKEEVLVAVIEGLLHNEEIKMQQICSEKGDICFKIKSALMIIIETFISSKTIWMHICQDVTLHKQFFSYGVKKISPYLAVLLVEGNESGLFNIPFPQEISETILSQIDFYIWQYSMTENETRRKNLFGALEYTLGLLLGGRCQPVFG